MTDRDNLAKIISARITPPAHQARRSTSGGLGHLFRWHREDALLLLPRRAQLPA